MRIFHSPEETSSAITHIQPDIVEIIRFLQFIVPMRSDDGRLFVVGNPAKMMLNPRPAILLRFLFGEEHFGVDVPDSTPTTFTDIDLDGMILFDSVIQPGRFDLIRLKPIFPHPFYRPIVGIMRTRL